VGGWLSFLKKQVPNLFNSIGLADSSIKALELSKPVLPVGCLRYQIDLMRLGMKDQWDVAFMLDVIEHLPDDLGSIIQAREALKRGGYLIISVATNVKI
jgi:SAM-dependent methyltransferase